MKEIKNNMQNQNFKLTGNILFIGEIETYERQGREPLSKRMIALEVGNGQKLFAEIRPSNFEVSQYLRAGQRVKVSYVFAGSEKNGKQYNNIIITEIEIV